MASCCRTEGTTPALLGGSASCVSMEDQLPFFGVECTRAAQVEVSKIARSPFFSLVLQDKVRTAGSEQGRTLPIFILLGFTRYGPRRWK